MSIPTKKALELVEAERYRQDILKVQGRFKYTCADPELGNFARYAVLCEEVGEVAREVLAGGNLVPEEYSIERLRQEVVQVAAIAVAWVEALSE